MTSNGGEWDTSVSINGSTYEVSGPLVLGIH